MAERWRRKLDDIGRIQPPSGLWARVEEHAHSDSRRIPLRGPLLPRFAAALVALALFAPAAYAGWRILRADVGTPGNPVPGPTASASPVAGDTVEVTCVEGGRPRLDRDTVALQADGVHFKVTDPAGNDLLLVRTRGPFSAWAAELGGEPVFPIYPSIVLVGCFQLGELEPLHIDDLPEEGYAQLEITDPENHWPALREAQQCGEQSFKAKRSDGTTPTLDDLEGEVLFWTQSDQADIYSVPASGGTPRLLLAGPEVDYDPVWSPDGSRVAFASSRAGYGDIWVMNADGTGLKRLTEDTETFEGAPAWSPQGETIAFVSNRGRWINVYVMQTDGSAPRRLTTDDVNEEAPAWSPDGERIAFLSERAELDRTCPDFELFVAAADGSDPVQLTDNEAYEQDPAWSPDGSKIVFMRSNRDDHKWDLWLIDVVTGEETRLTDDPGYEGSPVWSPDGSYIALSSDRDGDRKAIYVIDARGSEPIRITDLDEASFLGDWRR